MNQAETYFPFHRFNLRQNPFGTLSEQDWLRVTVLPVALETALADGFQHLQILGQRGRGKSTALHYLVHYFRYHGQATAYERLPRLQWWFQTELTTLDVFALDEMQRIAPWQAARLFQAMRGKRLIVGSHVDHRLAFWLRGWDVTTIRLNQQANRDRLARILAQRLDAFRVDETKPAALWFTPAAVDWLWATYKSDLRSMNFFLYDVFQKVTTPGPVTVTLLNRNASS